MKRCGFIIFCAVIFITVATGIALFLLSARTSSEAPIEYVLKIPSGATVRQTAVELQNAGIIRSVTAFYYTARFSRFVLKAGKYTVSSAMNVMQLLQTLNSTKPIPVRVSIPEGFTILQIADLLEKLAITDAEGFKSVCESPELTAEYRIPAKNVEGYLFPDTYFLDENMPPHTVVRLMIDNFFTQIAGIAGVDVQNPHTIFKMLTLASIVEREYRVAEEAPLMASVFTNRLKHNIGLESCATIVYILTAIQGKPHPDVITYNDLKIDNEYNTYKWAGLPPGPISNPGLTALNAAANPPQTDYYYFRLQNPEKGTHNFTATLSQHVQAGLSIKGGSKNP